VRTVPPGFLEAGRALFDVTRRAAGSERQQEGRVVLQRFAWTLARLVNLALVGLFGVGVVMAALMLFARLEKNRSATAVPKESVSRNIETVERPRTAITTTSASEETPIVKAPPVEASVRSRAPQRMRAPSKPEVSSHVPGALPSEPVEQPKDALVDTLWSTRRSSSR
jgi:hypothetical protein